MPIYEKMKILLAYPAPDEIKACRFGYSLLLLYVSSDLKRRGHDVVFADFSFERYSQQRLHDLLLGASYLVVDIDAFPLKRAVNIENAKKLCSDARRVAPRIQILGVGKHCSLANQALPFADLTVMGDPELAIGKLIDGELHAGGRLFDAGCLNSMDSLPVPDYGLLSHDLICGKGYATDMCLQPSALMETSRGCPGVCSFCQRKGWGRGIVEQSVGRVSEIYDYLVTAGIRNIWITDENFTGNLGRSKILLRHLIKCGGAERIKCSISSWTHIDEEFLSLAHDAGISIISFGIESVVKRNQEFFRKRIDTRRLSRLLGYADELGIYTVGNFIIGTPFDTDETISQSLDFAIGSALDSINVKTLDYMIGSDLYKTLPQKYRGLIHVRASRETGLCRFTAEELRQMAKSFQTNFSLSRKDRFLTKFRKFGPPYFKKPS